MARPAIRRLQHVVARGERFWQNASEQRLAQSRTDACLPSIQATSLRTNPKPHHSADASVNTPSGTAPIIASALWRIPLGRISHVNPPLVVSRHLLGVSFHSSADRRLAVPQPSEAEADSEAERRSPPTERVQKLVEEIAQLTLLEVSDLTTLLKRKLGLPDMPMGGMPMMMPPGMMAAAGSAAPGGEAGAAAEPEKVEKTSFDVKLEKFDAAAKLKVIKEVRAITGLGLKESKELVESAPAVLKKGIPKDEAESIVEKLKAVGGEVVLE